MEKVKLPREVADAIETISRMQNWKMRVMECMFDDHRSLSSEMSTVKTYFHYNGTNGELIMQALVNGYEVEQTPEDNVRDRYNRYLDQVKMYRDREQRSDELHWEGRIYGIRECLFDLGIKIEGVNT